MWGATLILSTFHFHVLIRLLVTVFWFSSASFICLFQDLMDLLDDVSKLIAF